MSIIYIVGVGMGNPDTLTLQALRIIQNSTLIVGAKRMVDGFCDGGAEKAYETMPQKILNCIEANQQHQSIAVLMSGDVGFYSGAKKLCGLLEGKNVTLIAGVSSVQYFCAKIKTTWEDVALVSLHGKDENICAMVRQNKKVFALTGGNVAEILNALIQRGLGDCTVYLGERLSYKDEKITMGTVKEMQEKNVDPLCVLMIVNHHANENPVVTHGIPDEAFARGAVPMTKSEVRIVSLSKLAPKKHDVVFDVGAGTGSVSIELAKIIPYGKVYAIEKNQAALALLEENKKAFDADNLEIINGNAPEALEGLETPNRVFIGGSSGKMEEILTLLLTKNPTLHVVVNAITLETVGETIGCFRKFNMKNVDIAQVSVAKSKQVGGYSMMMGQNPVYILTATGDGHEW